MNATLFLFRFRIPLKIVLHCYYFNNTLIYICIKKTPQDYNAYDLVWKILILYIFGIKKGSGWLYLYLSVMVPTSHPYLWGRSQQRSLDSIKVRAYKVEWPGIISQEEGMVRLYSPLVMIKTMYITGYSWIISLINKLVPQHALS